MITLVMYAKIRRMFFREHLSISEIQRRTSLSRNTIKKWLKERLLKRVKSRAATEFPDDSCKASTANDTRATQLGYLQGALLAIQRTPEY